MKSSQLKNKITDTSLFAELVKDRHKRELELKKLENFLENKSDKAELEKTSPVTITNANNVTGTPTFNAATIITTPDTVDAVTGRTTPSIPLPMDIVDIPIPSAEQNSVKLHEIALPETMILLSNERSENILTPPLPSSAPLNSAKSPPPIPPSDNKEINKKPKITKLPMPPGINQSELEMIESPPSRSPTPPLPEKHFKAKTPPPPLRKGIMNLPMPPGKCNKYETYNNRKIETQRKHNFNSLLFFFIISIFI